MASVSIEEKRLKQLKEQLFGKEQPLAKETPHYKVQAIADIPAQKQAQVQVALVHSASLKKDFTKIISFSILALSIQLALYFASKQGLINLFN